MTAPLDIAVLIPCYNEAPTIGSVVASFRAQLPRATIYVYDNNSTDETVAVARAAGAVVRRERRQGKGFVVRRMFADIEADLFVLVDGDDTYDADAVGRMIAALTQDGLDMVAGARDLASVDRYRAGHKFGNRMLTGLVAMVFGRQFKDMLTGYRVLSRRFVKSFPSMSTGFEIETELTVHALELAMPTAEVTTRYRDRPAGSVSKLSTIKDGIRIVWTIGTLLKRERPLALFGAMAVVLAAASLGLGVPVVSTYLETGLVPRLPTAVLAMGLMVLAWLSGACGLILDTVTKGRQEAKTMAYLAVPGVLAAGARAAEDGLSPVKAG